MKVTTHPRLFAGREDLDRFRKDPATPAMAAAHRDLLENARKVMRGENIGPRFKGQDPSGLGWIRAKIESTLALAGAWCKSGDEKFRGSALDHLRQMDDYKSNRGEADVREQGLWLSDGEEAACIAIVYDWLFDSLNADERAGIVSLCRRRLFSLGLERCRSGGAWWFAKRFSNWNAVCAGGMGMLCLAMYEECAEAREILPHVEESLAEFIRPLGETDGGWPEGLGYWNYGMAYAFQYLMSWERCTGKVHSLMKLPGTRKTLSFPFDFYPNDMSAGFGDNNDYHPAPFHYAAAKRFGLEVVMGAIDRHLAGTGKGLGGLMGGRVTFCVQHPDTVSQKVNTESQVARVYRGLGWGLIADRMPNPRLYLSMRGGSTSVEHCHVDLLSFRAMVGSEWLIENGRGGEYLHPTYFSPRRSDINDINATYKNTIFINGVGVPPGSTTDREQVVRGDSYYGLRMIATTAMSDHVGALFCGRLALMLDDAAFLIIDRTQTQAISRTESRLHSYADVTVGKNGAVITGKKESLRLSFASVEKAGLFTATTAPATPTDPSATMLRLCPLKLHNEAILVTLLTPGRHAARVAVEREGKEIVVSATVRGHDHTIRVRPSLTLVT